MDPVLIHSLEASGFPHQQYSPVQHQERTFPFQHMQMKQQLLPYLDEYPLLNHAPQPSMSQYQSTRDYVVPNSRLSTFPPISNVQQMPMSQSLQYLTVPPSVQFPNIPSSISDSSIYANRSPLLAATRLPDLIRPQPINFSRQPEVKSFHTRFENEPSIVFTRNTSPALRQRTAQACEKCRERKTKCSGTRPVCKRCTDRGLVCEWAPESRPRSNQKQGIRSRPVTADNNGPPIMRLPHPLSEPDLPSLSRDTQDKQQGTDNENRIGANAQSGTEDASMATPTQNSVKRLARQCLTPLTIEPMHGGSNVDPSVMERWKAALAARGNEQMFPGATPMPIREPPPTGPSTGVMEKFFDFSGYAESQRNMEDDASASSPTSATSMHPPSVSTASSEDSPVSPLYTSHRFGEPVGTLRLPDARDTSSPSVGDSSPASSSFSYLDNEIGPENHKKQYEIGALTTGAINSSISDDEMLQNYIDANRHP